jgi:AbiJ N-terminal domain 4
VSRFSQRIGLEKPREAIQSGSVEPRLRNRLWTSIHDEFLSHTGQYSNSAPISWVFYYALFDEFFGMPTDTISSVNLENDVGIKKWAMECPWNKFYDLVQFLADFGKRSETDDASKMFRDRASAFIVNCNTVLEQEKSAYRFVDLELVPITSPEELSEIEKALAIPDRYSSSRQHLSTALQRFSDRDNPD